MYIMYFFKKMFHCYNFHVHILSSFWMFCHISTHDIYPTELGNLLPKPPILLLQTVQVILHVCCVVIILNHLFPPLLS